MRRPPLQQLASTPIRYSSSEAAVTGCLHCDPRLAAHATHVTRRDHLAACRGAVQLAAVVWCDALAAGDAVDGTQKVMVVVVATAVVTISAILGVR